MSQGLKQSSFSHIPRELGLELLHWTTNEFHIVCSLTLGWWVTGEGAVHAVPEAGPLGRPTDAAAGAGHGALLAEDGQGGGGDKEARGKKNQISVVRIVVVIVFDVGKENAKASSGTRICFCVLGKLDNSTVL
jgi:hypothetical protein